MFVASKNRDATTFFEFISQPCGIRKLARALDMCIKRRRDQEAGRPPSDEPTRWVEMPESTHLPIDIGPCDPPDERMRISKRPTADTMGSPEEQEYKRLPLYEDSEKDRVPNGEKVKEPQSPKEEKSEKASSKKFALLVDDNELNLQLLSAYAKKDGFEYVTAQNGQEAVEIYKADPGKFQVVIVGMSTTSCLYACIVLFLCSISFAFYAKSSIVVH